MPSSDPYTQCIEALMTALRVLTDLFPKELQVSFDPYNITRGADYWFFVSPFGTNQNSRYSASQKLYQWSTPCELDVRFKAEAESGNKLIAARGEIVKLLQTPRLLKNINVNRVSVVPNGKPLQDTPANMQPNFLIQQMSVTIEQIVNN